MERVNNVIRTMLRFRDATFLGRENITSTVQSTMHIPDIGANPYIDSKVIRM